MQNKLHGHVLQGVEWAAFQRVLGREVARGAGDGWAWQGHITTSRLGSYLYLPYGPTARAKSAWPAIAQSWRSLGRPADFVRFEPMGEVSEAELERLGAHRVAEFQPQHTAVLDLTADEAVLRAGLASGHRNAVNGAERRGLSFRESTNPADGAEFLRLIHATAARTGFRPQSDHYLKTMLEVLMPLGVAKLFLAENEGKVVAASIALDYAGVRSYAHAASDYEARKLQAAVPLVWHMMLDAKAAGLREFDLWGVAPEGAPSSHAWAGFTTFKLAFGAKRKAYAGTWELPLRSGRYQGYRVYRAAKKVKTLLRGRS
jgi:lipid II:glycine glycyltransferase (peptidoglycan interpeptide bridge formation enzyme)